MKYKKIIKNFIYIPFCLFTMFYFSILSAFAIEPINFVASNIECDCNRLFTVDFSAKSFEKLSAAIFEIDYDNSFIEYREISTNENSIVAAKDYNGKIKISFLCSNGLDVTEEKNLFSIKFKAIKSGNTNISFNVFDCVNSNLESITDCNCVSSNITINENSSTKKSSSNSKTNSRGSSSSNNNNKTSSKANNTKPTNNLENFVNDLGFANSPPNSSLIFFIIGGVFGMMMVVAVVVAFCIGKKQSEKNNENFKK